jgi:hypothetical protein
MDVFSTIGPYCYEWHAFGVMAVDCIRANQVPMIASPYHRLSTSNAVRGIAIWILACGVIFYTIDGLATRPVPVKVESFRFEGMNDEQVLSMALQAAYAMEPNSWWIHDSNPYLVFEQNRDYKISPGMYAAFDLNLTKDAESKPIAVLGTRMAGVNLP